MESLHLRRSLAVNARRAFTLVELMVVLAIMIVVMSIVFTSQSSFNRTLTLANTAYDIALTLRSAETYGLGSRAVGSATNAGYGVAFQKATPTTFTLFIDTYPTPSSSSPCHPQADPSTPDALPGNCSYEAAQGEKVSTYTLGNGISISNFCAYTSGWSCTSGGSLTSLDIVFARPNAEPFMSANGSYSSVAPVTNACITVSSPQGESRFVSVTASGGITANASSCP